VRFRLFTYADPPSKNDRTYEDLSGGGGGI
jgi:hypothetical protein